MRVGEGMSGSVLSGECPESICPGSVRVSGKMCPELSCPSVRSENVLTFPGSSIHRGHQNNSNPINH